MTGDQSSIKSRMAIPERNTSWGERHREREREIKRWNGSGGLAGKSTDVLFSLAAAPLGRDWIYKGKEGRLQLLRKLFRRTSLMLMHDADGGRARANQAVQTHWNTQLHIFLPTGTNNTRTPGHVFMYLSSLCRKRTGERFETKNRNVWTRLRGSEQESHPRHIVTIATTFKLLCVALVNEFHGLFMHSGFLNGTC